MQSALPYKHVLPHVRDVYFQHSLYKEEEPNISTSLHLSTFGEQGTLFSLFIAFPEYLQSL